MLKGRILGDLARDPQRECVQVGSGDHIVDDPVALRPDRVHRIGGEDHLLGDPQAGGVEKGEHAADVVGHAELGRRDREGGGFGRDDHVATEHRLGRAAPHAAFDHRDDGAGEILNYGDSALNRIKCTVTAMLSRMSLR